MHHNRTLAKAQTLGVTLRDLADLLATYADEIGEPMALTLPTTPGRKGAPRWLEVPDSAAMPAVESGLALPPSSAERKYPFRYMAVGDSFTVPRAEARKVSNCFRPYQPMRFAMRSITGPKGEPLTRIWRVE